MPGNITNYRKRTKKGTKDFTREQKLKIVEYAAKVGINKAAEDYGTTWQAVVAMQKKLKTESILFHNKLDTNKAEDTNAESPTPAVEEKKLATKQSVNNSVKEYSPLEIENAILREKIIALTEQVEKLRSAVSHLA